MKKLVMLGVLFFGLNTVECFWEYQTPHFKAADKNSMFDEYYELGLLEGELARKTDSRLYQWFMQVSPVHKKVQEAVSNLKAKRIANNLGWKGAKNPGQYSKYYDPANKIASTQSTLHQAVTDSKAKLIGARMKRSAIKRY